MPTDVADDAEMLPLDMEEWLSWLATEGGPEADLGPYVGALRTPALAPATVARAVVAARSLHRFLAGEGRTAADPGAAVDTPRVPAGLPKALAEDEVAALLAAVPGDDPVARRDRAILEVLYGTGLRISELVGLRLGDVDPESALVRAFGKGAKERVVPVGRPAVAALAAWLGPGGRPALVPERWARRS